MKPYWLHLILTPKRRSLLVLVFFFVILYSYKYIYSRLSVITAFFKSLKPLTATDIVGYRFLITNYEIGYRFVGYRLSVIGCWLLSVIGCGLVITDPHEHP
jgi:hypothetical protein